MFEIGYSSSQDESELAITSTSTQSMISTRQVRTSETEVLPGKRTLTASPLTDIGNHRLGLSGPPPKKARLTISNFPIQSGQKLSRRLLERYYLESMHVEVHANPENLENSEQVLDAPVEDSIPMLKSTSSVHMWAERRVRTRTVPTSCQGTKQDACSESNAETLTFKPDVATVGDLTSNDILPNLQGLASNEEQETLNDLVSNLDPSSLQGLESNEDPTEVQELATNKDNMGFVQDLSSHLDSAFEDYSLILTLPDVRGIRRRTRQYEERAKANEVQVNRIIDDYQQCEKLRKWTDDCMAAQEVYRLRHCTD